MDKKNLRNSDILTGIIFFAADGAIIWASIQMILEKSDQPFYVTAGFLPLLLGVFFTLSGIFLAIDGKCSGGSLILFAPQRILDVCGSVQGRNTIFSLVWLGLYIFVMLEYLPYFIATFLYLVVMMVLFFRKSIVLEIVISLTASLVITFMFGSVEGIPLP